MCTIFKRILFLFVLFQALVSVHCFSKGGLYFDDQAKDGSSPTYSWTKMKMWSPFDGWGIMAANVNSEGQAIVSGGTLYVGAIIDPNSYVICSRYNINSGEWKDLYNGTETTYYTDGTEPSMVELDSFIYVIGGNDYESCRSINKYDIVNNCWDECCDLKAGVTESNLVIMDKKVLILDTKCYKEGEGPTAIIQMYDPAKNECFVVLEAAMMEKQRLKNKDLQLTVQNGSCYVICDSAQRENATHVDPDDSDGESSSPKQNEDGAFQVEQNPLVFEQNPRVFTLVCNLESDSPSVVLGEEIPQTHPHRNNYIRAFCIDDKTFVNVHGCVHKIKDGIANEDDLKEWRNITKTSKRPVHFTFDRRELYHTTDEEDEEEDE